MPNETVVLLIDDSKESAEAYRMLIRNGVNVQAMPSGDENLPKAHYKGSTYQGLGDLRLMLMCITGKSASEL